MQKFTEAQYSEMLDEKRIEILTYAIDRGCNPRCDHTDASEVEFCLLDDLVDDEILEVEEAEQISMGEYWN